MQRMVVRRAEPSDRANLMKAVVELQNYERELHETRLPGEQIADAYTHWMLSSEDGGLVPIAEDGGEFVGFVAGWIEHEENVAETPDYNRFGFIWASAFSQNIAASELRTSFLKRSSRTLLRLVCDA